MRLRTIRLSLPQSGWKEIVPTCEDEQRAGVVLEPESVDSDEQFLSFGIDRKLEKYPTDLRQIVGARIVKSGDKDRLEVTSSRLP